MALMTNHRREMQVGTQTVSVFEMSRDKYQSTRLSITDVISRYFVRLSYLDIFTHLLLHVDVGLCKNYLVGPLK